MSTLDMITLIANISLALSFIIALIFGISQVKAAARDRKERYTLDTLRNFQSKEFAELLYYIISRSLPHTMSEWRKMPAQEQINFIQFSQEMEALGLLVAERFVNLDLVDKTLGAFVVSSWEKFKPAITDMREKQPDPYLNEYWQWLAEQISKRMEKETRPPFHETNQPAV